MLTLEIADKNGCIVKLSNDPVIIEVLQSRPTVSFSSAKPIWVLEGGVAHLPISLSGRGPFEIDIKLSNGEERKVVLPGSARTIEVHGGGDYVLKGIKDSVCSGMIETTQSIQVLTFSPPSIALPSSRQLSDTCVGVPDVFQVDLVGKAPFKVVYTHQIEAQGVNEIERREEIVDTFYIKFLLDSKKVGAHTYTFLSISDDNYKRDVGVEGVVGQRVNAAPNGSFIDPAQKVFYCSSRSTPPYQLRMSLTGNPPFQITIEQRRDHQFVRTMVLTADERELEKRGDGSFSYNIATSDIGAMGKHEFTLQSLSDASSCVSNYEAGDVTTALEIADQARITTFNAKEVCIGDLLSYTLQGTPPFTVGYTWKGERQEDVVVVDPMLSFWAGGVGEIKIIKVI